MSSVRDNPSWSFHRSSISLAVSVNQLTFYPTDTWSPNGSTVANASMIGMQPLGLFIDQNDSIYVNDGAQNRTVIWSSGQQNATRILHHGTGQSYGIFAQENGDIYVDNGRNNRTVDKWSGNASTGVSVMPVDGICYTLFIDINETLYCAAADNHRIVAMSLRNNACAPVTVAGNGTCSSEWETLCFPVSIFVDINLNLYVADSGNGRIQRFAPNDARGTTVATTRSLGPIASFIPFGVSIDVNGYLFLVDRRAHGIFLSGPNENRCVVGCSGNNGSEPHQFTSPSHVAFDSQGNMFVLDQGNDRLQNFSIKRGPRRKSHSGARAFRSFVSSSCIQSTKTLFEPIMESEWNHCCLHECDWWNATWPVC